MAKLELIDLNNSKNFFRLGKVPFYYKPPTTEQFSRFIKETLHEAEKKKDKDTKKDEE